MTDDELAAIDRWLALPAWNDERAPHDIRQAVANTVAALRAERAARARVSEFLERPGLRERVGVVAREWGLEDSIRGDIPRFIDEMVAALATETPDGLDVDPGLAAIEGHVCPTCKRSLTRRARLRESGE